MLTKRQEAILDVIVGEYVSRVVPVSSSSIAQRHGLNVSPATIRNEMVGLEEEGYIHRRHVSGGGIPSDKGYRYYVDSLPTEATLSAREQRSVRQRFSQVKQDMEVGTRMLTELASELTHNMAVATLPKAAQTRIRRLEVVALQQALALLVLVLQEARIKQRLIPLDSAMTQDELTALSNKLSARYSGATREMLAAPLADLEPVERQVLSATSEILLEEDASRFEEPYISGLRRLLSQPEFSTSAKMRALVEVLEDRKFVKDLLTKVLAGGSFQVVIGEENAVDEMQECAILVSSYGSSAGIGGLIGVIGPTRMEYRRSVSSVRLLAALMGELASDLN